VVNRLILSGALQDVAKSADSHKEAQKAQNDVHDSFCAFVPCGEKKGFHLRLKN
jgi:hypothetical protein